MKRFVAVVFTVFATLQLNGQGFPADNWHAGEILLTDNTTRRGQVKYDLEHDAVQVKIGDRTETYSPQQVTSFSIRHFQRGLGKKRQQVKRTFFALPYENEVGFKRLRFFEVVVEGKATLLAREYINTVTANAGQRNNFRSRRIGASPLLNSPQTYTRTVLAHRMFLASLDGQIRELPNKRKDLVFMLKDHSSELKKFIKEERLRMDQLYDVARLFIHYNTISNQQSRAY